MSYLFLTSLLTAPGVFPDSSLQAEYFISGVPLQINLDLLLFPPRAPDSSLQSEYFISGILLRNNFYCLLFHLVRQLTHVFVPPPRRSQPRLLLVTSCVEVMVHLWSRVTATFWFISSCSHFICPRLCLLRPPNLTTGCVG